MANFLEDVVCTETPEETRARERVRMVNWMREMLRDKDFLARKAFMAKVHASALYHGITLEELLEGLPS